MPVAEGMQIQFISPPPPLESGLPFPPPAFAWKIYHFCSDSLPLLFLQGEKVKQFASLRINLGLNSLFSPCQRKKKRKGSCLNSLGSLPIRLPTGPLPVTLRRLASRYWAGDDFPEGGGRKSNCFFPAFLSLWYLQAEEHRLWKRWQPALLVRQLECQLLWALWVPVPFCSCKNDRNLFLGGTRKDPHPVFALFMFIFF